MYSKFGASTHSEKVSNLGDLLHPQMAFHDKACQQPHPELDELQATQLAFIGSYNSAESTPKEIFTC